MEGEAAVWVAMCLLAGLTVLAVGAREAVLQRRLQREGIRVRGLVVRHRLNSAGRDGGPPVRFAMVEFVDTRGSRHTFQSRSSGVKGLPVGAGVPVCYLHEAPKSARIDLARRRIGDTTALLAGGALFTSLGVWLLATGR